LVLLLRVLFRRRCLLLLLLLLQQQLLPLLPLPLLFCCHQLVLLLFLLQQLNVELEAGHHLPLPRPTVAQVGHKLVHPPPLVHQLLLRLAQLQRRLPSADEQPVGKLIQRLPRHLAAGGIERGAAQPLDQGVQRAGCCLGALGKRGICPARHSG